MKTENNEKIKKEINEAIETVNETLKKLKEKQSELAGDVRKEIDARIEVLEQKRKELTAKSAELGKHAGEAVRDLAEGVRFAASDLAAGVNAAWKEFRGK